MFIAPLFNTLIVSTCGSAEYAIAAESFNCIKHLGMQYRKFPDYANYKIYLGIGALSFDRYAVKEAKDYGIGLLNPALAAMAAKIFYIPLMPLFRKELNPNACA
jgi:hypothetical protein